MERSKFFLYVGLVGSMGGIALYGIESGKVRGEEVVYTSIYHGREIDIVQQDVKWDHDHCFIRGADLRVDEGELITDDGKLVSLRYTDACGDCYCIRDYQPNNTAEE